MQSFGRPRYNLARSVGCTTSTADSVLALAGAPNARREEAHCMRFAPGALTGAVACAEAATSRGRMTAAAGNRVVSGVRLGWADGEPGGRAPGSRPTVELVVRGRSGTQCTHAQAADALHFPQALLHEPAAQGISAVFVADLWTRFIGVVLVTAAMACAAKSLLASADTAGAWAWAQSKLAGAATEEEAAQARAILSFIHLGALLPSPDTLALARVMAAASELYRARIAVDAARSRLQQTDRRGCGGCGGRGGRGGRGGG
jgi:hypothetical protein